MYSKKTLPHEESFLKLHLSVLEVFKEWGN